MEYKHFSHEHNLAMHQVQQGQQLRCSGCDKFCNKTIYACWQCNFFLHDHCGNATRYIKHPFHSSHPLILSSYPTYPTSCFLCNACGTMGTKFSYCCALCEVDLHVHCAFLPPKINLKAHPHELILNLSNPTVENALNKICKICRKALDPNHWLYECRICTNYGVHTLCATADVKMGLYQMDDGTNYQPVDQHDQGAQIEVEVTPEEALALLHMMSISSASSYV